MPSIKFNQLLDFAILPAKEKMVDPRWPDDSSRWIKTKRVKGVCWPYRMAKELGWTIHCPIDIDIQPVKEIQTSTKNLTEFARLKHMVPMEDWVQKQEVMIGLSPAGWYKIHEYEYDGLYYPMLLPNGEGTFEWRQGWSIEIPVNHFILIQPIEMQDGRFIVYPGMLHGPTLARVQERLGLPLAFEPLKECRIRRGEPLAKLLVLPMSVLSIKSEISIPSADENPG
ncbi:hypothetical protein ACQKKK_17080 [Peribacillus sp. NPDC006672]|uniref:hypothetical protein n=1 Tax=Peribacillus sp. NPDC006672 TaxID=3390606 RepID=UPI003CFC396B